MIYDIYNFDKNFAWHLERWYINKKAVIDEILCFEGGWEKWVQLDFLAQLANWQKESNINYYFRREVYIKPEKYIIDWVFNQAISGKEIFVEIKAQGFKYNTKKFINDLIFDLNKLKDLLKNGNGRECFLLGFIQDEGTKNELNTYFKKNISNFRGTYHFNDISGNVNYLLLKINKDMKVPLYV